MLDAFILVLCIVAALIALVATLYRLVTLRRAFVDAQSAHDRERTSHAADRAAWEDRAIALQAEVARLAKWKIVADAEIKAAELLRSAQEVLEQAGADAEQLRAQSQQDANGLLSQAHADAERAVASARATLAQAAQEAEALTAQAREQADALFNAAKSDAAAQQVSARQDAKFLRDRASATLEDATLQVKDIILAAEKRAAEIAGSAYDAMKNASLFEQTVTAMKNIIDGYGDAYMVPERSLLDDLADDFRHTDAGLELTEARERSQAMVRTATAATCDYVEATRRSTAIRFVTDAFNGKVDSILSRVKNDNAGTLAQEMRDAFTLVNYNGKAFRDARITQEYLDARLVELKWAAIAQQLRLDERDEQRRIKEQLREEERARKEYERALRDAAREEELLRKAMEKALQKVQHATEEQKVQFEQQLNDLAERLRAAEERSQRALSMAQQTKRGHVYIISNIGSFGTDVYKIGLTRRLEPLDRIRELGDSSVPFDFDVHVLLFAEDAPALETQLHKHFLLLQMNKVNHRKEFFRINLQQIRQEIEVLGLTAKWTMTAAAREYRETITIEKAIKDDAKLREAWIKRQLALDPVTDDVEQAAEAAAG